MLRTRLGANLFRSDDARLASFSESSFAHDLFLHRKHRHASQVENGVFPDERVSAGSIGLIVHDVGLGARFQPVELLTRRLARVALGGRCFPIVNWAYQGMVGECHHPSVVLRVRGYLGAHVSEILIGGKDVDTDTGRVLRSIYTEFVLAMEAYRYAHCKATLSLYHYIATPRLHDDMDNPHDTIPIPHDFLTGFAGPALRHIVTCHIAMVLNTPDTNVDIVILNALERTVMRMQYEEAHFPDPTDAVWKSVGCRHPFNEPTDSFTRTNSFCNRLDHDYTIAWQAQCVKAFYQDAKLPDDLAMAFATSLSESFDEEHGIALGFMCGSLGFFDSRFLVDFLANIPHPDRLFPWCNPILNAVSGLFIGEYGTPIAISKCLRVHGVHTLNTCNFSPRCHPDNCGTPACGPEMHAASHLQDIDGLPFTVMHTIVNSLMLCTTRCAQHSIMHSEMSHFEVRAVNYFKAGSDLCGAIDFVSKKLPAELTDLVFQYVTPMHTAVMARHAEASPAVPPVAGDKPYDFNRSRVMPTPEVMAVVSMFRTWAAMPAAISYSHHVYDEVNTLLASTDTAAGRKDLNLAREMALNAHNDSGEGESVFYGADLMSRASGTIFGYTGAFVDVKQLLPPPDRHVVSMYLDLGGNFADPHRATDDHVFSVYFDEIKWGELHACRDTLPELSHVDFYKALLLMRMREFDLAAEATEEEFNAYMENYLARSLDEVEREIASDASTEILSDDEQEESPSSRNVRRRIDLGDLF